MPTAEDVHQRIQQRAYELWQQRSPFDGDALSDWLRAEAEVRERCRAARADEGRETAKPTRRATKRTHAKRER